MEAELKGLRIERTQRKPPAASKWATRWIVGGVALFLLLGAGRFAYEKVNAAPVVEVQRVKAATSPSASGGAVILNATGYIIAAHRIQVAAKVVGKVSWIGVDKGTKVKEGQVIVRLEDDEYRAQLQQARGAVAYAETLLSNTIIRAPVTGTILERAVEKGEFVTTSFVGDKGAKGYVVSLADLNDLQVELDISQNDFAKLGPRQRGVVTTDAFRDRPYEGYIEQISPEANRQKATVQIKVRVVKPDEYLRPEMDANVA